MILDYTKNAQLTKNFNVNEFKCNDVTKTKVPTKYINNVIYLAVQLQKIRDYLGLSFMQINSAYRTEYHNNHINGAKNSNHLTAMAADTVQYDVPNEVYYNAIKDLISAGLIPDGEVLKYGSFVHYAPSVDFKQYPQPANTLYDVDYYFTYKKDIPHAKFEKLQKIKETINKAKSKTV